MLKNDPIGLAIQDFINHKVDAEIIVKADLCEDDVMPVSHLFRSYEQMPELEQLALSKVSGHILDVGAGAGCHALWLQEQGHQVTAIDISAGAVDYMQKQQIEASVTNLWELEGTYDTILLLMNGIGLAGKLDQLEPFLNHLKKHLNPNGQILCDSTDIAYLYEEEDGSVWVDLNSTYRGEMQFKMVYKGQETPWFNWLYLDFETLKTHSKNAGMNCELLMEGDSFNFLCRLTF
jgi:SAM-dependent methyltransferase